MSGTYAWRATAPSASNQEMWDKFYASTGTKPIVPSPTPGPSPAPPDSPAPPPTAPAATAVTAPSDPDPVIADDSDFAPAVETSDPLTATYAPPAEAQSDLPSTMEEAFSSSPWDKGSFGSDYKREFESGAMSPEIAALMRPAPPPSALGSSAPPASSPTEAEGEAVKAEDDKGGLTTDVSTTDAPVAKESPPSTLPEAPTTQPLAESDEKKSYDLPAEAKPLTPPPASSSSTTQATPVSTSTPAGQSPLPPAPAAPAAPTAPAPVEPWDQNKETWFSWYQRTNQATAKPTVKSNLSSLPALTPPPAPAPAPLPAPPPPTTPPPSSQPAPVNSNDLWAQQAAKYANPPASAPAPVGVNPDAYAPIYYTPPPVQPTTQTQANALTNSLWWNDPAHRSSWTRP